MMGRGCCRSEGSDKIKGSCEGLKLKLHIGFNLRDLTAFPLTHMEADVDCGAFVCIFRYLRGQMKCADESGCFTSLGGAWLFLCFLSSSSVPPTRLSLLSSLHCRGKPIKLCEDFCSVESALWWKNTLQSITWGKNTFYRKLLFFFPVRCDV